MVCSKNIHITNRNPVIQAVVLIRSLSIMITCVKTNSFIFCSCTILRKEMYRQKEVKQLRKPAQWGKELRAWTLDSNYLCQWMSFLRHYALVTLGKLLCLFLFLHLNLLVSLYWMRLKNLNCLNLWPAQS